MRLAAPLCLALGLLAACAQTREAPEGERQAVFAPSAGTRATGAALALPKADRPLALPLRVAWTASVGQEAEGLFAITAAPTASAWTVYAADGRGRITALDMDGGLRWSVESGGRLPAGGLAFADGYLYIATGEGELLSLDAATGAVRWRAALAARSGAAPLVAGRLVIAATQADTVEAFAADTGRPAWKYAGNPAAGALPRQGAPKLKDSTVFAALPGGSLAGLDAKTGRLKVLELVGDGGSLFDPLGAAPLFAGDRIYAATWGGPVAAISLKTGREPFAASLGTGDDMAAAGSAVFVSTPGGHLAALDADSGGTVAWEVKLGASLTAPVLAGDKILVGADASLLAVEPATGQVAQTLALGAPVAAAPVPLPGGAGILVMLADGRVAMVK
ncbi:pyrrolo-quinoline quinone [Alphaproteobacteria bacterium]|nr:pyrrolo-quinoline quinone [Alphaproteobacteria bacterium]